MEEYIGIDEAGRGPVIGPLVICGCVVNDSDRQKLKEMGVKDSKLLTPKKREELFSYLIRACKHHFIIIGPQEIDESVKSEIDNLNHLEAKKASEIIKELCPRCDSLSCVTIDCPSININAYTKRMCKLVGDNSIKIVCEHKADVNHIEVSCASIIAKVTRDRIIDDLRKKHIEFGDIGSGYSSDPLTREFVCKNYNNKKCKDIFRKSWQTYRNLADEKKQNKLERFF